MKVEQVMNQQVAHIGVSATFQEAAELLALTQASDLIVVDPEGRFLGVVSEGDLLRALIPDYNEVAAAGGSMHDVSRIFTENGRDLAVTRVLDQCGKQLALERLELGDCLESLLAWSATWLGRLKQELTEGIKAFETHEAHVVERAGQRLTDILAGIPALLTEYLDGLERASSGSGTC